MLEKVKSHFIENRNMYYSGAAVVGATGITVAVAGPVAVKGAALVATGTALCVGFWIGKQITNKFDEFLIMRNKELVAELQATI
jgi:hypothetical protein